jgi:hypothetical protein
MRFSRWTELKTCLTPLAVLAAMLPVQHAARAQVYQVQQGNVLDANPQMGSGGLNRPARTYDFDAGNRIISGNVTGGAGFQGFSPIRSPNQLFIAQPTVGLAPFGLPSESLSTFRRDTLSVADVQRGGTFRAPPQPYYSPQSTVTDVRSATAGLYRPGTSSPYVAPREDFRVRPDAVLDEARLQGNLLGVSPRLMRIDDGRPVAGEVNQRLLGSSLFGGFREVPATAVAWRADRDQALGATVGTPLDLRVERLELLDRRVETDPARIQPAVPLDQMTGRLPGTGDQTGQRWEAEPLQGRMVVAGPQPDLIRVRPGDPTVPTMATTAISDDVFVQMRAATGQLLRPLDPAATIEQQALTDAAAPGERMLRPLAPPEPLPDVEPEPMAAGAPPADQELSPAPEAAPLETFVGAAPTLMNRYLAEAEAMMRAGQYYRAAAVYDVARSIQPDNPLPLLGRSMALLASGDYMTSANNLFQAIQMFEALGHFQIDLTAFIPDLAALDRRRADLERRLETHEDFRLRFLLGYAEYNSGMEERGTAQMEQAAAAAPDELAFLQRFVQILRDRPGRE